MKCFLILLCLFKVIVCDESDNTLRWGRSYSYDAILTVPGSEIKEPYKVWVDGKTGNTRVDYYNGLVKIYRHRLYGHKNTFQFFKVHPQAIDMYSNKEVCHILPKDGLLKMYSLNTYLPLNDFVYQGPDDLDGEECQKWQFSNYVTIYGFHVLFSHTVWVKRKDLVDIPLRYNFRSSADNVIVDEYNHEYLKFDYKDIDDVIFRIPDGQNCTNYINLNVHEPIDPLLEYIDPEYGNSRIYRSFESFKDEHNKFYKNKADQFLRMMIFKDNIRFINSENRKHNTYTLAVNHLADLNNEEFSAIMKTTADPKDFDNNDNRHDDIYNLFEKEKKYANKKHSIRFDWRDFNAVTPVKDQTNMCGSCYAFATAAAVESALYIQRGFRRLLEISEQAILDCSWSKNGLGNIGCEGGTIRDSLNWIVKHGVPFKADYGPYLAMEGFCHHSEVPRVALINGFTKLIENVRMMKFALNKRGPLVVGVNTTPKTFQFYAGGVYSDEKCSSNPMDQNHAMVVIGYGQELGLPYWTLKNSFGSSWGEDGYIRIAIPSNVCGVSNNMFSVNASVNF